MCSFTGLVLKRHGYYRRRVLMEKTYLENSSHAA
jgi:hypothetical protein